MFTKIILSTVLAACGTASTQTTAEPPNDYQPPPVSPKDEETYFCCDSVDGKTGSGEGCSEIPHSWVGGCPNVLKCSKGYAKDKDGKVTCIDA